MSRKTRSTGKPSMAERMAALRARVERWQEEHDDEEIAMMVAEFEGYSERNAILIAMQCPTATELHGFKAWLDLGRCVRKGESGIQILAPAGKVETKDNGKDADGETVEGTRTRQLFRLAYVFDVAQTDPLPTPQP